MTEQAFVWKDQKKLRMGYTTGSCAAAAAKAAARMLFLGEEIRQVSLMTPKGIRLYLDVEDILRMKDKVRCAIRKDAGDDPDVTDQILVYAEVSKTEGKQSTLDGGVGVGRITRKGNKYYVHIYENTLGPLPLIGFDKNKIVKVRALDDGHEVPISTLWVHSDYPDIAFVDLGPDPVLPDPVDYVLEVEMAE